MEKYQDQNFLIRQLEIGKARMPKFSKILKASAPDYLKRLSWHFDDSVEFNVTGFYEKTHKMKNDFFQFLQSVDVLEYVENPRNFSRVVGSSPQTDFSWHIHYSSDEFKSLDKTTMELYNFYKAMISELLLRRELIRDDLSAEEIAQAIHWNPNVKDKGVLRYFPPDRIEIRVHHQSLMDEVQEIDRYFKGKSKTETIKLLVGDIDSLISDSDNAFKRSERFTKKFAYNKYLLEVTKNYPDLNKRLESFRKNKGIKGFFYRCFRFLE